MSIITQKRYFKKQSLFVSYCIAFGIGIIAGLHSLPIEIWIAIYFTMALFCLKYAYESNIEAVFATLAYISFGEIYIRDRSLAVPYNFCNYFYVFLFCYLLLNQKKGSTQSSSTYVVLFLFTVIEALDFFRSLDKNYYWMLCLDSLTLSICVLWSCYNRLTPKILNHLFKHIKIAGVFLLGLVAIAHFRGDIQYTSQSNASASNGLPPVQLSAYFGLTCILFFLSIMNSKNRWDLLINISILIFTTIIMMLTFSRGGLYFLGGVIFLYLYFNRTHVKSYAFAALLIPAAIVVFFYVNETTGGRMADRYEQKGSSGRDLLVEAGFSLFKENYVAGVGTGNFNNAIEKEHLYHFSSGAHNEFVRTASEHGLMGIITYWGFYAALFVEILRRKKLERDFGIYFFTLFCLIIVHNGLKIAIQPLILIIIVANPSTYKQQKNAIVTKQTQPILT